jgi:ribonucleotide monophosphatase NagD (HAD superfamily)
VAGKPEPPCYLLAAERLGLPPREVLAIGDRLDTDIAGAHAAGMDSLLVLTGVDDRRSAEAAPPGAQPTHIAADLRALLARD